MAVYVAVSRLYIPDVFLSRFISVYTMISCIHYTYAQPCLLVCTKNCYNTSELAMGCDFSLPLLVQDCIGLTEIKKIHLRGKWPKGVG